MYSIFNDIAYEKSKVYFMKIYATQLQIGEEYKNKKRVNQINFIEKAKKNNKYIKDEIKTVLEYADETSLAVYYKTSLAVYYRLDLIKEVSYNLDRFIRWLYFISAKTEEERKEVAKGDEILMSLDKWLYDYTHDETSEEFFDDRKWDRLIHEQIGRDEGIEIGKNERTIDIARKLKKSGLSIEEIEKL